MPHRWKEYFLGKPLATRSGIHERLSNMQGLAIFGADALSSTAYATEEILLVLVAFSTGAFSFSVPIALSIAGLIFLVAISYQQVIHAYPQGGGVYNVAKKNLGEYPALVGGASLLIDYVLTVAVSTTAGVAAITSAFPMLFPHRVLLGIVAIVLLTWVNLRGIRESGKLFSVPTYIFIGSFVLMIGYGIWRHMLGTFPVVAVGALGTTSIAPSVGALLLLRAFAAGCTAMTGIEAVSNGVPAFKKPESENAARTLKRMALLLGVIFVGITFMAYWGKVVPIHNETILSQIARLLFDHSPIYYLIQASTALVLLLAANTPFADFPRVASQLSKDGYFPHQFYNLGSRLVFANGIILLSLFSCLLVYFFGGNVHALIPLYAVGVFLGFSISQFGMIRHWLNRGPGHGKNIAINTIGLLATVIVFVIVFLSKFIHGAWILIPGILLLVSGMKKIKQHYIKVEKALAIGDNPLPVVLPEKTAVLLVSQCNSSSLYALKIAKSFEPAHIRAVHVAIDEKEGTQLKKQWQQHVQDVPIDIVPSQYRDIIGPILEYLKNIDRQWKNDSIIVFIPQIVPSRWWHYFLHNQTNKRIQLAIEQDPDINPDIYGVTVKTPKQQKSSW